jgi:hypothetical protein
MEEISFQLVEELSYEAIQEKKESGKGVAK